MKVKTTNICINKEFKGLWLNIHISKIYMLKRGKRTK